MQTVRRGLRRVFGWVVPVLLAGLLVGAASAFPQPPVISEVEVVGNEFRLRVGGEAGHSYFVSYKADLADPQWTSLAWAEVGTWVTDPIVANGSRFYILSVDGGAFSLSVDGAGGGNVYSVNTVGYANRSYTAGVTLVASPFRWGFNRFGDILSPPPDGTMLITPEVDGLAGNVYVEGEGWLDGLTLGPTMRTLAPGEGALLRSDSPVNLTWFGDVPQGDLTVCVPVGMSLRSMSFPRGGPLHSSLGFPSEAGDVVFQWNRVSQTMADYFYDGFAGLWFPHEPVIEVGESFWVYTEAPKTWSGFFVLPFGPGCSGGAPSFPGCPHPGVPEAGVTAMPQVLVQPRGQSVAAGSNVVLRAAACGSEPLSYEWRRNGTPVPGGTGPSLMLNNFQAAQAGSYTVVVSNAHGTVDSAGAVLMLEGAPAAPRLFIASVGGTVVLSWEAPAEFFVLEQAAAASGSWTAVAIAGSPVVVPVAPGLTLFRLRSLEAAVYSLNVVGYMYTELPAGGHVLANPFRYSEMNLLNEVLPQAPHYSSAYKVGVAGLERSLYADIFSYDFHWYDGQTFELAAMTINPGEGLLLETGEAAPVIFLGELPEGALTNRLPAGLSLCSSILPLEAGLTSVLGFPAAAGDVVYQWDKASQTYHAFIHLGAGAWDPWEPVIRVGEAFWADLGSAREWVNFFSASGLDPGRAHTVENLPYVGGPHPLVPIRLAQQPPGIVTQPQGQVAVAGASVEFSVVAAGTGTLHYEWRFDGQPIGGETSAVLTLTNVQPDDAGAYVVSVSNAFGTTNSVEAILSVSVPVADLVVAEVTDRAELLSGQPVVLSWTVTNAGSAAANGPWTEALLAADTAGGANAVLLAEFVRNGTLDPGTSVVRNETVIVPAGLAGTRHLLVCVDSTGAVPEGAGEDNNCGAAASPTVVLAPDLVVDVVGVPLSAELGGPLAVSWTVRNAGTGPASAGWGDQLYLSADEGVDPVTDALLAVRPASGAVPLAAGADYEAALMVTLPSGPGFPAGDYHLVVVTDASAQQEEVDEANNVRASVPVTLSARPRANLTPLQAAAPATARAGETVTVTWAVTNRGLAEASGVWVETVHLSGDGLPGLGTALASFVISNALAPGAMVERAGMVTVPVDGPAGELRFGVVVDSGEAIEEGDETDNLGVASATTIVPLELTMVLPRQQVGEAEANPVMLGTVRRNGSRSGALSVSLSSGDPGEITVPGTVVMGAGVAAAAFAVSVVADGVLDGGRLVELSAEAGGFLPATAVVEVVDAEVPRLGLAPATSSLVEGGSSELTLTREFYTSEPLMVQLNNPDPGRLLAPETVIIPAGELSVTFPVGVAENDFIEAPRTNTLTASAAGFVAESAGVVLLDNDLPALGLAFLPGRASEGAATPASGLVTRVPAGALPLTVELDNAMPGLVHLPSTVVIPALQTSVWFQAAIENDLLVNGARTVQVCAFATTTAAGARLGAGVCAELMVEDDDGPALTVTLAQPAVLEGDGVVGMVGRNNDTTGPLQVSLGSSDETEAVAPAVVIIPAGAASTEFMVQSLEDDQQDGNQPVTVTATAAGYATGAASLVVTDQRWPDLVVRDISFPGSADGGSRVVVSYTVVNQGLGPMTNAMRLRLYASLDAVAGDDLFLGEAVSSGTLGQGSQFRQSTAVTLPAAPGHYWIVVVADAGGVVAETVEQNNITVSAMPIMVEPVYRAVVQTDLNVAPAGTPVPLYGSASFIEGGAPAPFVPVNVHILVQGTRRVLGTTTDFQGQFQVTFVPLAGEVGHYEVYATRPGELPLLDGGGGGGAATAGAGENAGGAGGGLPSLGDEFDLVNLRFDPVRVAHRFPALGAVTNRAGLTNVSALPLAGLGWAIVGAPPDVSIEVPPLDAVPAGGGVALDYVVRSLTDAPWSGTVLLLATNVDGLVGQLPLELAVLPLRPVLAVRPGSLRAGMVPGQSRLIRFRVRNEGGRETDLVQVSPPAVEWLRVVTPLPLGSLPPGGEAEVTLQLLPPSDIALGFHSGTLVISCAESRVNLPFSFRALSEATGDLAVEVVDEYTYYAEGAPRVADALVRLTDSIDGALVAEQITGPEGQANWSGVREGYYDLEVAAEGHSPYHATLFLEPGLTNRVTAFVSRQMVRYQFTVEPGTVPNRARISLRTVFETAVPIPVVTVDPGLIDLAEVTNDLTQVDLKITNHGLVRANDVRLGFEQHGCWELVPLVNDIGAIDGLSSVVVPVLIHRLGAWADPGNDCGPCTFLGHVTHTLQNGPLPTVYSNEVFVVNACHRGDPTLPPEPQPGGFGAVTGEPTGGGPVSGQESGHGGPAGPGRGGTYSPPRSYTVGPSGPVFVAPRVTLGVTAEFVARRPAFRATLELENPLPAGLSGLEVRLRMQDRQGVVRLERFVLSDPEVEGLGAVDGTGGLPPGGSGRAVWVIVPLPEAAPVGPEDYLVGGTLSYTQEGYRVAVPLALVAVTVLPGAELAMDFFLQRDVYSDDPFTAAVEPAIPFALGVLLRNAGPGIAFGVQLGFPQPEIVSNQEGLQIDFRLLGTHVGTQAVSPDLTMRFGNLDPGATAVGLAWFSASLQGLFTDYDASLQQVDAAGDPRLALLRRVTLHELIHVVRDPRPGADLLADFLANDAPDAEDLPDTVHLSEGAVEPVTVLRRGDFDQVPNPQQLQVRLTNDAVGGWSYLRVPDPGAGGFHLVWVERDDGQRLPLDNFWLTDRTFLGQGQLPRPEPLLHLVDHDRAPTYRLQYALTPDTNAPSSQVAPLPAASYPDFPVSWSGEDGSEGSGVAFFDLYVSEDGGPFTVWLAETRLSSALFPGASGHSYAFYSVATDHAGHRELAPGTPDAQTAVVGANRPPVLAAVGDLTLEEGGELRLQLDASDPDLPLDTLRFQLEAGPAGAVVDAVSGLVSWATGEAHGDSVNPFMVAVTDNGIPSLTDRRSFMVFVRDLNLPPLVCPQPVMAVSVGELLSITNCVSDPDIPQQTVLFRLGWAGPANATLDPVSGVLRWRPGVEFASQVQQFAVVAEDDGVPPLSATQWVAVVVNDYLALGLGTTNVISGQGGGVDLGVYSSAGIAEVEALLEVPAGRVNGLSLVPVGEDICTATLQPLGEGLYWVRAMVCPGRSVLGTETIARLSFTTTPGPSAFVPLRLSTVSAWRPDGERIPKVVPEHGRVVIIGAEALLEAWPAPDRRRMLTLYGNAGVVYEVEAMGGLEWPLSWMPGWSVLVGEGLAETMALEGVYSNAPALYLRAVGPQP